MNREAKKPLSHLTKAHAGSNHVKAGYSPSNEAVPNVGELPEMAPAEVSPGSSSHLKGSQGPFRFVEAP